MSWQFPVSLLLSFIELTDISQYFYSSNLHKQNIDLDLYECLNISKWNKMKIAKNIWSINPLRYMFFYVYVNCPVFSIWQKWNQNTADWPRCFYIISPRATLEHMAVIINIGSLFLFLFYYTRVVWTPEWLALEYITLFCNLLLVLNQ